MFSLVIRCDWLLDVSMSMWWLSDAGGGCCYGWGGYNGIMEVGMITLMFG
ncbi:hypothetical protein [Candidatus Hodgkinia cicadicola]